MKPNNLWSMRYMASGKPECSKFYIYTKIFFWYNPIKVWLLGHLANNTGYRGSQWVKISWFIWIKILGVHFPYNKKYQMKTIFLSWLETSKRFFLCEGVQGIFHQKGVFHYFVNTVNFNNRVLFYADRCSKYYYIWNSKYLKKLLMTISLTKNKSRNIL